MTSIIDTEEGRYVVIIDIPNTFTQKITKREEDKGILSMIGNLTKIIILRVPEIYHKYKSIEIYIYGITRAVLFLKRSLLAN